MIPFAPGFWRPRVSPLSASTKLLIPLTGQNGSATVNEYNSFGMLHWAIGGSSATTSDYPQSIGSSFFFDGIDDYIDSNSPAAFATSGDFTLEWLMKPTTFGAYSGTQNRAVWTMSWGATPTSATPRLLIGATGFPNTGKLLLYDGSTSFVSTNALTLDAWQHIAYVRLGTTLTCYIGGASNGSTTWGGDFGDAHFLIGVAAQSSPGYYQGLQSYYRLSTSASYTSSFTVPTLPYY